MIDNEGCKITTQDAIDKAVLYECNRLIQAIEQYVEINNRLPESLAQIGFEEYYSSNGHSIWVTYGLYERRDGFISYVGGSPIIGTRISYYYEYDDKKWYKCSNTD